MTASRCCICEIGIFLQNVMSTMLLCLVAPPLRDADGNWFLQTISGDPGIMMLLICALADSQHHLSQKAAGSRLSFAFIILGRDFIAAFVIRTYFLLLSIEHGCLLCRDQWFESGGPQCFQDLRIDCGCLNSVSLILKNIYLNP